MWSILLGLHLFLSLLGVDAVSVLLTNKAGTTIEVWWVNPDNGNLVSMGPPITDGQGTNLNSFSGHKFIVRFAGRPADEMKDARFTKGPEEEKITVVYDHAADKLKLRYNDKFSDVMQSVNAATTTCQDLYGEAFSNCVADTILDDVEKLSDRKSQMNKYRDLMSSRLRNYTCADDSMDTTQPIRSYDMQVRNILNPSEYSTYTVNELLSRDNAKIWYVDNFVTPEECDVLMTTGRPNLKRATVAAEDGTSIVSEARKANQASYNMNRRNPEGDPLWSLFNRALDIVNQHAGYSLTPPGQEDFTIIQYNANDQYTPHCDGTCDGSLYTQRGRVATAVMYCKTADRGGATTFTKSDIFVKPKPGSATFFSYKGSDGRMDEGYTEHSGCPVLEGEKFITTIWMREGVTEADPWTSYDPSGVRILYS